MGFSGKRCYYFDIQDLVADDIPKAQNLGLVIGHAQLVGDHILAWEFLAGLIALSNHLLFDELPASGPGSQTKSCNSPFPIRLAVL
jgi:hypothetical protein